MVNERLDDPKMQSGYAAHGSTLSASSVTVTTSAPVATGDYYIIVVPSSPFIDAFGAGATPAPDVTQPYTLTVTE